MDAWYIFLIVITCWIGISLGVAALRRRSKTPVVSPDDDVHLFIYQLK